MNRFEGACVAAHTLPAEECITEGGLWALAVNVASVSVNWASFYPHSYVFQNELRFTLNAAVRLPCVPRHRRNWRLSRR